MYDHMLPCRVFVVIRNSVKSVCICECDLYGRYICYKNMVYICNVCCVHIIRPDNKHPIIITRGDLSDSGGVLINIRRLTLRSQFCFVKTFIGGQDATIVIICTE